MPNGDDKNWSRLCTTLNAFYVEHQRWPTRVRISRELLDDLRGHLFTPRAWARIARKLDFVADDAVTIIAADGRDHVAYDGAGPKRMPLPSADEWLGVEPNAMQLALAGMDLPRFPTDVSRLLAEARRALSSAKPMRVKGMDDVVSGPFEYDSQGWVAVRAPQSPGCARLIDVAVAQRVSEAGACGTVAILSPQDPMPKKAKLPEDTYVRRYQAAAWYGLGIVFVLDVPDGSIGASWKPSEPSPRGEFDDLADSIEARLRRDRPDWIPFEDSRELEGLVRISVDHALRAHGFQRSLRRTGGPGAGKSYQGFWRGAEADGVWARTKPDPTRLALEVKLGEDVDAPLCQVIDDLGHSDAVVNVRDVTGERTDYGAAQAAMDALGERLSVRYIETRGPST